MKYSGETLRRGAAALKAAAGYLSVGAAAVLTAVILSVLFLITPVTEGKSGLAVALKPAYLFAVPEEGDFVVYRGESLLTEGSRLETGRYDGAEIPMESVRGKVIAVIALHHSE